MTTPLDAVLDRLWDAKLRPADEFTIFLEPDPQDGALFASVPAWRVWRSESLDQRYRAVCRRRWVASTRAMSIAGEAVFLEDLFGREEDFGFSLMRVMHWHHRQRWDRSALTEGDLLRAKALDTYAVATRQQYRDFGGSRPPLNLRLALRCPDLDWVIYPMVAKVPLVSVKYYVEVLPHCTFAAIRRSRHPRADEIISHLYELLFLQQKTGLGLFNYLSLANAVRRTKAGALLTKHEIDQIMMADALVPYLKATIEKVLLLLAALFGISGLDGKKNHRARLSHLRKGLPASASSTFYAELLLGMVASESFADLDRYRSGLLHKRGVAQLQPHSYVGVDALELPDLEIFGHLHEQHSKNSAALVAALAMLADNLVKHDPPPDPDALMYELMSLRTMKLWCEREAAASAELPNKALHPTPRSVAGAPSAGAGERPTR